MYVGFELINQHFQRTNESMNETGHRPSLPTGTANANEQIATASENNIERIIERCTIIIPYPNELVFKLRNFLLFYHFQS